jgi:type II secretory ATPase GspE/PulE/Tfp pilus assembly ATPase PilB-like protein
MNSHSSAEPPQISAANRRYIDFEIRLHAICDRIHETERLEMALEEIQPGLLGMFDAERITLYERTGDGRALVSRFCTVSDAESCRLPLGLTSVPGYVAMSQQNAVIDDVYDHEQLQSVHDQLSFDYERDQAAGLFTRSVMAVPITSDDSVLGVLELANKLTGAFSSLDVQLAQQLAAVLAQRLAMDRESTAGPFQALIDEGIIAAGQLDDARRRALAQKHSIGFILRRDFELTDEQIGQALEKFYSVPYMTYDPTVILPEPLMELLNRPFLIRNRWVPVGGDREHASILIDDPTDNARLLDIQRILGARQYDYAVGLEEDILTYLGVKPFEAQPQQEAVIEEIVPPETQFKELLNMLDKDALEIVEGEEKKNEDELTAQTDATIIQLVNKLIAEAVEMKASDIHVEPRKGDEEGIVRMRVDGLCRQVLTIPAKHVRYVVSRVKIMSKVDISETRLPQDGKITCRLRGVPLELRVATLPTVNGESVIMRVLSAGEPLPFAQLNLRPRNAEALLNMLEHPHGIVLVVGPTGSGKTTTLHALLAKINTPERKILTAEDPVEITQPGLQQLQVRSNIGLTFARALRSFLRCDPDVILIGEMRDLETAHSGIEASLTGHLVFSTLHTNSAPETVTRLLDMGLDPLNFADAMVGIVAQRLVRTLCKECKETYVPEQAEIDRLVGLYGADTFPELGLDLAQVTLCRPKGCEKCSGTGYRGRTGVHEVLMGSREMKNLVVTRPGPDVVRTLATQQGMRTLLQDGVAKIFMGQTDLDQVRRIIVA